VTPRVAVVTARYGDPWDEVAVLASRLAGALACRADVNVLMPGADEPAWDGACRLLRFPADRVDPRIRAAWRQVAMGIDGDDESRACTCPTPQARRRLPPFVEEHVLRAEGGDAPALYDHLRQTSYDATVFVGLHSPLTSFGLRALPQGRRALVAPAQRDHRIALGLHDQTLRRADRILACTEGERSALARRIGPDAADRVENIGFLLGVNRVACPEPNAQRTAAVVVAGDWRTSTSPGRSWAGAEKLAHGLPDGLTLHIVGPGAALLPHGVAHTDARIDAWWWMSRALAVIDPVPHRVVGQEVLEAMLLGTPVVVAANGAASREHAEVSNGGLWYRTDDELINFVDRLSDGQLSASLADQALSYATNRFADPDSYVKRVAEVVLG
jgi:hypothetical protein